MNKPILVLCQANAELAKRILCELIFIDKILPVESDPDFRKNPSK